VSLKSQAEALLLKQRAPDGSPWAAPGAPLIVAVSGGPDSLALLHMLARQSLLPAEALLVAHLDHALRPSSAAEAHFVAATAAEWGVAGRVERVDVRTLAETGRLTLEAAARQARYDFLARVVTEAGGRAIATGHTADDQAETVLMHILRGSGTAGLRGMLPASPVPGHPHLTLLRPWLRASRAEIVAYCQEHRLRPITDESNTDPAYFRNRLRHELLPLLAAYNPHVG
jgi:tRNA(Ile)-lysidine synthase